MAVRRRKLMENPHYEGGSQDEVVISASESKVWQQFHDFLGFDHNWLWFINHSFSITSTRCLLRMWLLCGSYWGSLPLSGGRSGKMTQKKTEMWGTEIERKNKKSEKTWPAQMQPDFSHLSLEELGVYRETVVVGGSGHQVEEESLITCFLITCFLKLLCFVIKKKNLW